MEETLIKLKNILEQHSLNLVNVLETSDTQSIFDQYKYLMNIINDADFKKLIINQNLREHPYNI